MTLSARTRTGSFVLRGVTSLGTYAAFVAWSAWPPSQAFQLRVSVQRTVMANRSTITGVANLCQAGLRGGAGCSTTLGGFVGTGDVAIVMCSCCIGWISKTQHRDDKIL